MAIYKSEDRADLEFNFPDDLDYKDFDAKGKKMPNKMKLVDLVINRGSDILMVEIKDPSNSNSHEMARNDFLKKLQDNSIIYESLAPKARDSYTFLHLMELDKKPIIYIVLIGMETFSHTIQQGLLGNFKDRLLSCICNEAYEPWKVVYIKDCLVLSVDKWNQTFPHWPVRRISSNAVGG